MVIQDNDPKIPPIRGHFNQLLSFGEVRASYFIRKLVDGKEGNTTTATANCNNPEDKMVYLPTTSGFLPMYYRYMQEEGYKVTVCETGEVSVAWDGENNEERLPCALLSTYFRIWKRGYP